MDRHRIRIEAEAVVIADNRDCDRGGTCRPLAENQKRSANHHYRYRAECNGVHRISQTVQLQPICCFTQHRKSNTIVTVDSVSRAAAATATTTPVRYRQLLQLALSRKRARSVRSVLASLPNRKH